MGNHPVPLSAQDSLYNVGTNPTPGPGWTYGSASVSQGNAFPWPPDWFRGGHMTQSEPVRLSETLIGPAVFSHLT